MNLRSVFYCVVSVITLLIWIFIQPLSMGQNSNHRSGHFNSEARLIQFMVWDSVCNDLVNYASQKAVLLYKHTSSDWLAWVMAALLMGPRKVPEILFTLSEQRKQVSSGAVRKTKISLFRALQNRERRRLCLSLEIGQLWLRRQSGSSTNHRVSNPNSSNPHVEVPSGKIVNPKSLPLHPSECECVGDC